VLMIIKHNGTICKELTTDTHHLLVSELNTIMQDIHAQGRVVKGIWIDGTDVTGSIESFLLSNQGLMRDIQIESVSPDEIISSLYSDTVDLLQRISEATEKISDMFYGEVSVDGWNQLSQLSEALGFTIDTLQTIADHGLQEGHSVLQSEVTLFTEAIKSQVNEINQAIEYQDMVMVGDIIRYELGQSVSRMLNIMESRVEQ